MLPGAASSYRGIVTQQQRELLRQNLLPFGPLHLHWCFFTKFCHLERLACITFPIHIQRMVAFLVTSHNPSKSQIGCFTAPGEVQLIDNNK
jgi:hypothetical protein